MQELTLEIDPSNYSDTKEFIVDFFVHELKKELCLSDEDDESPAKQTEFYRNLMALTSEGVESVLLNIYEKLTEPPFEACQTSYSARQYFSENLFVEVLSDSLYISMYIQYQNSGKPVKGKALNIEIKHARDY